MRRALRGAAVAVAVLSVLAVAAVATRATTPGRGALPGPGSTYAALTATMPPDTVQALTTPPGVDWWQLVAPLAPAVRLAGVDPAGAGVALRGYGFSLAGTRSDLVRPAAPLFPALYLQAATGRDAAALAGWLTRQPAATSRTTLTRGPTVIVVPSWVDPTAEYPPAASTPTPSPAAAAPTTADPMAVLDLSWGRYTRLLSATAPADRAQAFDTFTRAIGFTPTTRFTATAATPRGPWTGTSTGVDVTRINLPAANAAVAASGRVTYPTPGGAAYIRSAGLDRILAEDTLIAWAGGRATAGIGARDRADPMGLDPTRVLLTGVLTPAAWESAVRGIDGQRAGPPSIRFSVTGDGQVALRLTGPARPPAPPTPQP